MGMELGSTREDASIAERNSHHGIPRGSRSPFHARYQWSASSCGCIAANAGQREPGQKPRAHTVPKVIGSTFGVWYRPSITAGISQRSDLPYKGPDCALLRRRVSAHKPARWRCRPLSFNLLYSAWRNAST